VTELEEISLNGSRRLVCYLLCRNGSKKQHFIYQEGKTVFKFAVSNMADVAEKMLAKQLKKKIFNG